MKQRGKGSAAFLKNIQDMIRNPHLLKEELERVKTLMARKKQRLQAADPALLKTDCIAATAEVADRLLKLIDRGRSPEAAVRAMAHETEKIIRARLRQGSKISESLVAESWAYAYLYRTCVYGTCLDEEFSTIGTLILEVPTDKFQ